MNGTQFIVSVFGRVNYTEPWAIPIGGENLSGNWSLYDIDTTKTKQMKEHYWTF